MNECTFAGCDKKVIVKSLGLCTGHYWQHTHGQELRPLKPYKKSDIGIDGYRRCNFCDEIKKVSEFYKRSSSYGYYSRCKGCHNARREPQNAS